MKIFKKSLAFFMMIILLVSSTMSVEASDQSFDGMPGSSNVLQSLITTKENELPFQTGEEIASPNSEKIKEIEKESSNHVSSFAQSNYTKTKALAEEKAKYLIGGYGITSVQYALISDGQIVLSGYAGSYDLSGKVNLNEEHMYGIASISKVYTTAAVMKLVEEGRINLDTPVKNYISEFTMADSRYEKITPRMLLNHSSGLMGSSFHNAVLFNDNDTYAHDNFLKQLSTQRLKADPGAYSVYCNDGFTLAEILVEKVTGMTFTNYLQNTFFEPLKLDNTKTTQSNFDKFRIVKAYYPGISKALPLEFFNTIGAGGLYSSAVDICEFSTTFMRNSNGLLSQATLRQMENKEYLNGIWPSGTDNVLGYGLGWDCVDTYPFNQYNMKALSKGGDSYYYHSNLTVLPEENMAIAVLSSGGSSGYDQLMAQEILLCALKEKGVINEIKPDKTFTKPVKVTVPSEIKKYEGLYAASILVNIKIAEEGTLTLSYPEAPAYGNQIFIHTGNGIFTLSDGSASIEFVEETNGKVYIKQKAYGTLPLIGQTAAISYVAQKVEQNPLTETVEKAWAKRENKNYYIINEKYSSIDYMLSMPMFNMSFLKELKGYWSVNKIIDENNAVSILDGPGTMSRDLVDYSFYTVNNVEYLKANDYIFMEENAIKTLSSKRKFTCTIKEDGYAKWYKIGKKSEGKKVTIKVPKNAAFVLYDSNGSLINNSLLSNSKTVTLPTNGMICFIGKALSKFTINYK